MVLESFSVEEDTNLPTLLLKQSQSIGNGLQNVYGFILEPERVLLTIKSFPMPGPKEKKLPQEDDQLKNDLDEDIEDDDDDADDEETGDDADDTEDFDEAEIEEDPDLENLEDDDLDDLDLDDDEDEEDDDL